MKIWITKYALTRGIIEAEIDMRIGESITITWINKCPGTYFKPGEWFKSKEDAIKKAEEMRKTEIEKLTKKIKKLEKMRFQ